MSNLHSDLPSDPLDMEFRELERKVRARGCDHQGSVIDVTQVHHRRRRMVCDRCGKQWSVDE